MKIIPIKIVPFSELKVGDYVTDIFAPYGLAPIVLVFDGVSETSLRFKSLTPQKCYGESNGFIHFNLSGIMEKWQVVKIDNGGIGELAERPKNSDKPNEALNLNTQTA